MAVAAAGLVLGVGGTVTLAAWVDTEWVYGGTGGDEPGVGTSTFVVEQDPNAFTGTWLEEPDNPGSELTFTPDIALALTPGDVIYATVALRTTPDSMSGTTQLQDAVVAMVAGSDPAVEIESDDALFDALYLRVGVADFAPGDAAPTCNALELDDGDYTVITDGLGLDASSTGPQTLDAAAGNVLHYCFEISLDEDAGSELMGLVAAPAWEFLSESD